MIGCVSSLRANGEFRRLQGIIGEMARRHRRSNYDWTARQQRVRSPKSHIFVQRTGVPVDPVDAQISWSGREGLDGEHFTDRRLRPLRIREKLAGLREIFNQFRSSPGGATDIN
jgi:hypothetical protein